MTLTRRDFVATGALATTGLVAPSAALAEAPVDRPALGATVPFDFDLSALERVADEAYAHRQVAAPPTYAAATALMSRFKNALDAYTDPHGFAGGARSLHCAAVLYAGRSYTMAFDDAMYAKYPIGLVNDEEMRPDDTRYRAYWTAVRHNTMMEFLRPLIEQGLSLFVCNHALSGFALELARRVAPNGSPPTRAQVVRVHDDLASHFVPRTMLVPAGVAAVNALQEHRYTYLPS